ncbi:hypothetical protein LTR66_016496 [Elasticomyces elasticus]|nr:hypothetical protein LTR66_016496 [Elasticomyces elasticus]
MPPHRISAACNACRSRKQKCSGPPPTPSDLQNTQANLADSCEQCEAADIACIWPEQKKRGPAKGYIEGLEKRVFEVEALLLQILPSVPEQDLEHAVEVVGGVVRARNHDRNGSPSSEMYGALKPTVVNMKTGMEHWEEFSLTSVGGVRRWVNDCQSRSRSAMQVEPEVDVGPRKRQKRELVSVPVKRNAIPKVLQTLNTMNANLFAQPQKPGLLDLSMAAESLMPMQTEATGIAKAESHLFW